jgi:hypothetical protein
MSQEIASGRINIDLNDTDAIAGLRKVDAEFNRLMNNVEHSKATAEIDADISDLQAAVKTAAAEVKRIDGLHADAILRVDKTAAKQYSADLKKAQLELKALDGSVAEATVKLKGDKEFLARVKALEDAQDHLAKAVAKANADTQREINKTARVQSSLNKQRIAEMKAAESEAHRVNDSIAKAENDAFKARQKQVNASAKFSERMQAQKMRELTAAERLAHQRNQELNEIPKLEKAYASLTAEVNRLEQAQIKAGKRKQAGLVFKIDIDRRIALQELDKLRNELTDRLGHAPLHVPLEFPRAHEWGSKLRREMDSQQKPFVATAVRSGAIAGLAMGNKFVETFKSRAKRGIAGNVIDMSKVTVKGGKNAGIGVLGKLGDLGGKLADMTVRLGPFTATIRTAVLALSLLGPIILDVVGSLGALAAVTGAGVVGAMGAATGAIGAFGVVGASVALLLPQLLGGYKQLGTLQKAYHSAEEQYGKGSKEATKALEKYNNALQASSPSARGAFEGMKALKQQVKSLSNGVQGDFDKTALSGVNAGKSLLTAFGPQMQQSFKLVSSGVRAAFKGLSGDEGKSIIGNLFKNGLASLPSFGRGLGNLAHAAGLVASAFSNMLPSLGGGFEKWTEGIENFTKDAGKMERFVSKTTTSMQKLGHFLASAGRLMGTFFAGGVDSGQDFLDTMTQAMDRWNAFLKTGDGQDKLGAFFKSGVAGLQAFYGAIAPIVSSFVAWSAAIAPVSRGIFLVVGAVSEFIGKLLAVTALRGPLAALGATLAVLWGLGKVRAATAAVQAFGAALRGVAGTQKAIAASNAGAGALGAFGSRNVPKVAPVARVAPIPMPNFGGVGAAAGGADKAAGAVTKLGRAGSIAKTGLSGLGALVTGVASPMMGLGILAAGAAAGIYLLSTRTKSWEKANQSADKSRRVMYAGLASLPGLTTDAAQANLSLEQSQLSLTNSQKALTAVEREINKEQAKAKPNQATLNDLYAQRKQAVLDNRQALISETQAMQQNEAAQKSLTQTAKVAFDAAIRSRNSRQKGLDKRGEEGLSGNLHVLSAQDREGLDGAKNYAEAYKNISKAAREAGISTQEFINRSEALKGDEKLQQYAKQQQQVANATRAARNAYNDLALSQANQARITNNQIPLNAKAAASFGTLTRLAGKSFSTKIATKYDDPNKAAKVGAAASAALKRGAGKTQINAAIKANPKDALAAARQINQIRLNPKTLNISERGASAVRAKLVTLVGTKMADKIMTILGSDDDAKSKLNALKELKLSPALLAILGDNVDALNKAKQAENQRLSPLNQKINRTFQPGAGPPVPATTQRVVRTFVGGMGRSGADGGAFASGGRAFASGGSWATNPNRWQQDRAATTASMAGTPQKAVSQKITGPKYLVGEEKSPEFVIATNPAYRERNKKYLKMAARAVGVPLAEERYAGGKSIKSLESAFKQQIGFAKTPDVTTTTGRGRKAVTKTTPGTTDGTGYYAQQEAFPVPKAPTATKKAKKGKVTGTGAKTRRGWTDYLDALRDNKTDWEREVGIRESQIKEPKTLLEQTGTETVTDPDNPNKTKEVPKYEIDNTAVVTYQNQIASVMEAIQQVMLVIQKLIIAIPAAVQAIDFEKAARTQRDKDLGSQMKAVQAGKVVDGVNYHLPALQYKTKNGKKTKEVTEKSRAARDKAMDRRDKKLDELKEQRSDNKSASDELPDMRKGLIREQKDLGFDYREQSIRKADYGQTWSEIAGFDGKGGNAAAELKQMTEDARGTGGGGGGTSGSETPLSYAGQTALAAQEYSSTLQQFGSNMAAIGSSGGGATIDGSAAGSGGPGSSSAMQFMGEKMGAAASSMTSVASAMTGSSSSAARAAGTSGGAESQISGTAFRMSGSTAPSTTVAGAPAAAAGATNTVVNNFAAPPPDAHTFTQGIKYELNSLL